MKFQFPTVKSALLSLTILYIFSITLFFLKMRLTFVDSNYLWTSAQVQPKIFRLYKHFMKKYVFCSTSEVMLTHMHTTKPISRIFSCTSGTNLFAHAYRIFMKQRKRAKKVKKSSWKIVYTGPRYD